MNVNIRKIVETYLEYYEDEKNSLVQLQDFIKNEKDIYNSRNQIGHITASGFIYSKKDEQIFTY